MSTVKIERIVGQNVAALRAAKDWSQPRLGAEIGRLLGSKSWSRQAVSNAERGDRAFSVADLVAIAAVLETSPGALLTLAPASTSTIELGDASFRPEELQNPMWTREATSQAIDDVVRVVSQIAQGLDRLQDAAEPLWRQSLEVVAAGSMLAGRVRLEEANAEQPGDYGVDG